MNMSNYIYSEYLGTMIIRSFTYHGYTYKWCEDDLLYWNTDTEEDYFSEVPEDAC